MSYVGLSPDRVRTLATRCRMGADVGWDTANRQAMVCTLAALDSDAGFILSSIGDGLAALARALDAKAALAESLQFDPSIYGGWGLIARLNNELDDRVDQVWDTLLGDVAPPDDMALAATVLQTHWEVSPDGTPDKITGRTLLELVEDSDDPSVVWAAGMVLLDHRLSTALTTLANDERSDGEAIGFGPDELAVLARLGAEGTVAKADEIASEDDGWTGLVRDAIDWVTDPDIFRPQPILPPIDPEQLDAWLEAYLDQRRRAADYRRSQVERYVVSFLNDVEDIYDHGVVPFVTRVRDLYTDAMETLDDAFRWAWVNHGPNYDWGGWGRAGRNFVTRYHSLPWYYEVIPVLALPIVSTHYTRITINAGPVGFQYSGAGGEQRVCMSHSLLADPRGGPISLPGALPELPESLDPSGYSITIEPSSEPPSSGTSVTVVGHTQWGVGGGVTVGQESDNIRARPVLSVGAPGASVSVDQSYCSADLDAGIFEDPVHPNN